MPKIIIDNDSNIEVSITADNTEVLVKEGYNLALGDSFAIYNSKFDNAHIVIQGHVDVLSMQNYAAIATYGNGDEIDIGKNGTVNGPRAIALHGENQTVVNRGVINGSDAGIRGDEGGYHIVNTGKITSTQGDSVVLGGGDDTVVNKGIINGTLDTGSGADHIDLRGGYVNGGVFGGDGNDVYWVGKTSFASLYDSDGYDIIRTSVSYTADVTQGIEAFVAIGHKNISLTGDDHDNNMGGNAGKNHISTGAGEDFLGGGAGHDVLTGGLDADTFYFRKGDGRDTVTDFEVGGLDHDKIYLSHFKSIDSFDDIQSHMSLHNGNTVIDMGHGDHLTIHGVKPGELSAADFSINGVDLM